MIVTAITLNEEPVAMDSLPAGAMFSTDNSGSDLWVKQDALIQLATRVSDGLVREIEFDARVYRCIAATLEA